MSALKAAIKGVGNGLKEIGKKNSLPFARPNRIDRELYFQSCGTGHCLFRGTCLAIDPRSSGVLD